MDKNASDNEKKLNSPSSEMPDSPNNNTGKMQQPNQQNDKGQCTSEGKDCNNTKSLHTTKTARNSEGNLIIVNISIQGVTKDLVPPFLMLQDSHFDIIKRPFNRVIL